MREGGQNAFSSMVEMPISDHPISIRTSSAESPNGSDSAGRVNPRLTLVVPTREKMPACDAVGVYCLLPTLCARFGQQILHP